MQLGPPDQLMQIPAIIYWVAGILILSNLGTIVSILYIGGKAIWWASKMDTRVAHAEADISEIKDGLTRFIPARR